MIAFDNGPANGDYVRYIDDLTRRAAVAASAGILTDDDIGGTTLARVRDRLAAEAASRLPQAGSDAWTPASPSLVDSSRTTGFAPQAVTSPSATAAAAIASALMSGQTGQRIALPTHMKIGLGAVAVGIALIVAGILWVPFNLVVIVGGGAVIAWAVRMMRDASARAAAFRT